MIWISHLSCTVQSSKDAVTFFMKYYIKTINLLATRSSFSDPLGLFFLPSTKGFGWFLILIAYINCVCEREAGVGERETESLCVNAMVCLWKSDSLWKLFLSFHHVGPKDGTQGVGFSGKYLSLLSHFTHSEH